MNKLLKDCKIRSFKVIFSIENKQNLSDFFSVKNIKLGDQLLKIKFLKTLISKVLCFIKCAQFLSALFIILVGLMMT